eukprot:scaffold252105_cov41-Prasinocladus_malaysianus.AAC.1
MTHFAAARLQSPKLEGVPQDDFPALLKPHWHELQRLPSLPPTECKLRIQSLYAKVIHKGLSERRLCIVLEDAHEADEHLIEVIETILSQSQLSTQPHEPTDRLDSREPISSIILAHRTLSEAEAALQMQKTGDHLSTQGVSVLRDVSCVELTKMAPQDVLEIARIWLGNAVGISSTLQELIQSENHPTPSRALHRPLLLLDSYDFK